MTTPGLTIMVGAGASAEGGGPSVQAITERVLEMESPRVIGDVREYYLQQGAAVLPAGAIDGLQPSEPAIQQIERALRSIRRRYNFETILHAVETLEPYSASRTLLEAIADVRPMLTAFTDPTPRYESLMNWALLWRTRWEIIRTIRDLVVSGTVSPSPRYLQSTAEFIERLRTNFRVSVFNLNYDDLFERTHHWADGFMCGNESWAAFDRAAYVNALREQEHTMTHLHGSIKFGYRLEDPVAFARERPQREVVKYAQVADVSASLVNPPTPTYTDDVIDDAAPLISGANKVLKFSTAPYSYYFAALQQAAQRNDRLLFIGYGFNDPHINNWALEAVQQHGAHKTRVAIIDFRPIDRVKRWELPANATFAELMGRLARLPLDLRSAGAREFICEGHFGLSGGGFPVRSDITEEIVRFLLDV